MYLILIVYYFLFNSLFEYMFENNKKKFLNTTLKIFRLDQYLVTPNCKLWNVPLNHLLSTNRTDCTRTTSVFCWMLCRTGVRIFSQYWRKQWRKWKETWQTTCKNHSDVMMPCVRSCFKVLLNWFVHWIKVLLKGI